MSICGLPTAYVGITYEGTALSKVKQNSIKGKIDNAPRKGSLVIQGTAAPIVNHLMQKRKVRGIDFIELTTNAFAEHVLPMAEVILLYNVGVEVSTNYSISSQIFNKVRKYYAGKSVLLIIETDLGKTDLLHKYDFRVTNFLRVPIKEEEVWV